MKERRLHVMLKSYQKRVQCAPQTIDGRNKLPEKEVGDWIEEEPDNDVLLF